MTPTPEWKPLWKHRDKTAVFLGTMDPPLGSKIQMACDLYFCPGEPPFVLARYSSSMMDFYTHSALESAHTPELEEAQRRAVQAELLSPSSG